MRQIFTIILLAAFINSFSQKAEFDMGKASVYCESYPIKENFVGKVLQGTGFIIEHLQKFYFVTNYHNVVDHDFYTDIKSPIELSYEKIRLILKRKIDNQWGELYLNLIKEDGTNNFNTTKFNGDDADIIALPLKDISSFIIQPVTIPKKNRLKNNDIVFIIGFPNVVDDRHFQLAQFGNVIPNPDTNKAYEKFKNNLIGFVDRRTSPGFSGSPVYLWPNTKKAPVLAGINAAVDIKREISIFWRVEVLHNLLAAIK